MSSDLKCRPSLPVSRGFVPPTGRTEKVAGSTKGRTRSADIVKCYETGPTGSSPPLPLVSALSQTGLVPGALTVLKVRARFSAAAGLGTFAWSAKPGETRAPSLSLSLSCCSVLCRENMLFRQISYSSPHRPLLPWPFPIAMCFRSAVLRALVS